MLYENGAIDEALNKSRIYLSLTLKTILQKLELEYQTIITLDDSKYFVTRKTTALEYFSVLDHLTKLWSEANSLNAIAKDWGIWVINFNGGMFDKKYKRDYHLDLLEYLRKRSDKLELQPYFEYGKYPILVYKNKIRIVNNLPTTDNLAARGIIKHNQ